MNLNLDEIDAKVATIVMGWKLVDRVRSGWGSGPPVYSTNDEANPTFQDFQPTREIDHAWRVVCRLRQLKFAVRIEANRFPSNDLVRVWANDDNEEYGDRARGNSGNEIAPATAPLHICLAALDAVSHRMAANADASRITAGTAPLPTHKKGTAATEG